jgi:AAA15 family ATPase/GTPase
MLKSLTIKNFRCFEEFDLPQLGRVNLLVGKNNSGKTSVIEAIHILESLSLLPFSEAIERRGEHSNNARESKDIYGIRHLYSGHHFSPDKNIYISGKVSDGYNSFELSFVDSLGDEEKVGTLKNSDSEFFKNRLDFKWYSTRNILSLGYAIPFSKNIPTDLSTFDKLIDSTDSRSMFIALPSMKIIRTIELFNQIVLTPLEEILYDALRFIEPKIERIAPTTVQGSDKEHHGGFIVAIDGKRVPIGSMGDGIWRMLEITLAMVNIPGGTLLIDEIDTGLHFSVMVDLWKLICKTAEKLDIQVFATTHNSDCWKSLAEVANSDDIASDDITIHRIERGKKASIVFNEQEMAIAADRDIEVR